MQEILDNKFFRDFNRKRFGIPLGLLHIGSVLEANSADVKLIDLDRAFFHFFHDDRIQRKNIDLYLRKALLDEINKFQPDLIGISGNFNTNVTFINKCCRMIKKQDKTIPIVLGGHYFTNTYKMGILNAGSDIDYIVIGEGEEVMLDIVNAIVKGDKTSLNDHPNIASHSSVLNKKPAIVADINTLPPINYDLLVDLEDYLSSPQDLRMISPRRDRLRAIAMMTSRGCPNQCTYCASHKVHGKKIRAFSVDRIINEIKALDKQYDINVIIFEDDLFTYSRKRTVRLCKEIYECFGDRFLIEFPNGIAVNTLNEECIYWLAKAGMRQIHIAIETGNQYVQDEVIKKKLNLELVKPVVELLRKYDVNTRAYFIMGFPGETLEMMRDTKMFAKAQKLDWAVFSFASPIVGSELYETVRATNQLVSDGLDGTTYYEPQIQSDDWTHEEVREIQEEANFEVNFLGNYNLEEGNYEKSFAIFNDILFDYPDHLFGNYCLWKSQIGLDDHLGAKATEEKLYEIIKKEKRNTELLKKYNLLKEKPFVNFLID